MKNFDSRTYSVNDFLEWDKNKQLQLSPKFQRRSVWTENARSYLMDTIIRGLPIPKIFIRQQLDTKSRASVREVVDGQQRLRTILSFLSDGFKINKKHNSQYGGTFFSQLSQVDEFIQANILNYEISVDLLVNMPDTEVLDVFSRLNSYAVILNQQEKINSNHFGPFKILADRIAHKYNRFWLENKILREQEIFRMGDVTLVADLLIAMIEGIKSKKQIKSFYDSYEKDFQHDPYSLEGRFDKTIEIISNIFQSNLSTSEFTRIHLFYTLFTAIYHLKFGIENIDLDSKVEFSKNTYAKIYNSLLEIHRILTSDAQTLSRTELRFVEDSRRATTDGPVRVRRTKFIVKLIDIE